MSLGILIKKRMGKKEMILAVAFVIIATVITFSVQSETPSSAVVVGEYESPQSSGITKAIRLHDRALDFFDVEEILFPRGVCLPAAHELYGSISYVPVDVSAGYSTSGAERTSTYSFVIDRHEKFGTIDFVKSPTFLAHLDVDSLITISSEAIVRVPKAKRTTYMIEDLYATTIGDKMYIKLGRFSTPSTDCIFVVKEDKAYCDCDVHTIEGISVAGITSPSPVETRYKDLVKQAEETLKGQIPERATKEGVAVSRVY
jgi:hypothetical protein